MESENKAFFRYPATKVAICELQEGEYQEEHAQNINYILTPRGKKIFRVNIVATIVHKEIRGTITDILIDDGTGKIILRFFEENKIIFELEVGEVILIIGRVRKYNQEKYILPEIAKKTDLLWLKFRAHELRKEHGENREGKQENYALPPKILTEKILQPPPVEMVPEEITEDIEESDPLLPIQKLCKLITELDQGEGVLIEEIIEKSPLEKTEELLEKMLENGDIFHNVPGKVRIL